MKKNEKIVLAFGFVLILFVIIFTIFRNNPFSKAPETSFSESQGTKDSASSQQTISAKDLQKKIAMGKNSDITLLDVRSFEDYAKEHIVNSVNISLDEFPASTKINVHNQVIVIGANSNNSDVDSAVEKLNKEGFENVKVLAGGMESWQKFAGATVTYGDPTSFTDQSKVSYVKQEDLNEALKQKVPMYILDVRTGDEFSKGHIPGAKNLPFEELEKRKDEITEKKVVVVGINELQEFQASVQMYDMLLVSPFVLKGAMPQWEKNGYSIEK